MDQRTTQLRLPLPLGDVVRGQRSPPGAISPGAVFQPKCAAYLNLIEPWWKVLRSLALKGRRFETWEQVSRP